MRRGSFISASRTRVYHTSAYSVHYLYTQPGPMAWMTRSDARFATPTTTRFRPVEKGFVIVKGGMHSQEVSMARRPNADVLPSWKSSGSRTPRPDTERSRPPSFRSSAPSARPELEKILCRLRPPRQTSSTWTSRRAKHELLCHRCTMSLRVQREEGAGDSIFIRMV